MGDDPTRDPYGETERDKQADALMWPWHVIGWSQVRGFEKTHKEVDYGNGAYDHYPALIAEHIVDLHNRSLEVLEKEGGDG